MKKKRSNQWSHRLIKEVNKLDLTDIEKYLLNSICQYKQLRLDFKSVLTPDQIKEGLKVLIEKKYVVYLHKAQDRAIYYFNVNTFKIEDDAGYSPFNESDNPFLI